MQLINQTEKSGNKLISRLCNKDCWCLCKLTSGFLVFAAKTSLIYASAWVRAIHTWTSDFTQPILTWLIGFTTMDLESSGLENLVLQHDLTHPGEPSGTHLGNNTLLVSLSLLMHCTYWICSLMIEVWAWSYYFQWPSSWNLGLNANSAVSKLGKFRQILFQNASQGLHSVGLQRCRILKLLSKYYCFLIDTASYLIMPPELSLPKETYHWDVT